MGGLFKPLVEGGRGRARGAGRGGTECELYHYRSQIKLHWLSINVEGGGFTRTYGPWGICIVLAAAEA